MDLERELRRVAKGDRESLLQVGKALGYELPRSRLDQLAAFRARLGTLPGAAPDSFAAGFRAALMEITRSYARAQTAELDSAEHVKALREHNNRRRLLERLSVGPERPANLAASFHLPRATVSRELAALEAAGFVSAIPGVDRRQRVYHLTPAGAAIARKLTDADDSGLPSVVRGLTRLFATMLAEIATEGALDESRLTAAAAACLSTGDQTQRTVDAVLRACENAGLLNGDVGGPHRDGVQLSTDIRTIASDLRRLGVRPGDLLMVHASLRAIGPVEEGAHGVLAALRSAVGPGGTLLMVLGARDDHAWVNERPEAERPGLLADATPFDPLTTPAEPEVGVLAEVFRTLPDTRVSDHPEGRFGAAGPLAERLTSQVPWDDYFGPGSPLERLVQHHGRVLRLGADTNTVTLFHHGEYLARLPVKRRVRRHRRVLGPDGPTLRVVECLDDCDGIVDYSPPDADYFADILTAYLATGRGHRGTVGGATSELLDAADALAFSVQWMERNLP